MSVKFKSAERVNPRDLTLPRKYYAQIINGDDVNFDELADLISKVSSLNYGEVLGVLGTLIEIIEMQLQYGRQVHLSNLGTFFLTLISEGMDSPDDLTSDQINGARIRFRPGKRLKKLTNNLDFIKIGENGNGQAS
jgi:predicted histone-like DNA-binding protein